jgi:protein-S-isoprenylcysteine O-methyltransferase Ste14
LRYTTYIDDYIPLAIHLTVGTIVLLLALILSSYGMKIVFGEVQEKPGVIRKGVYGRFRHPIYLGEMLLYLSLIIFKTSLAALSIWIIAVLFLHYLSRFEERLLLERFGDDYRQYMKDVPMYFPRIIKSGEKRKIID